MTKQITLPVLNTKAELDLKISKQDIIDMVIAERQTEAEALVADLNRELKTATKVLTIARETFYNEMIKEARKEYRSILKILREPDVEADYQYRHQGAQDLKSIEFSWSKARQQSDDFHGTLTYTITETRVTEAKSGQALLSAKKTVEQLEEQLKAAHREETMLVKRGAMVKARIVREMLLTTDEGKAILEQVSHSARLLLPSGTTRAK